MRVEEEGNARGKFVDVESGIHRGLHVGHAVAQGEGDFLHRGRSGFSHVVAGDGDGVPVGNVFVGPGEQVGDDAHGLVRGIDISAARDVLLQNVVLDRTGEFANVGALAPGDRDIKCQQDGRGRIDGHRGGNFGEVDAGEQALHVLDGVDGDADFADFAGGQWVIGVQADLGRKVEGDGESGSAVGEQVFVALVGFLGVAHAGVLAHGPEAAAIHGRLHAPGEGILAGIAHFPILIPAFQVGWRVQAMNGDVGGSFGIRRSRRGGRGGLEFLSHGIAISQQSGSAKFCVLSSCCFRTVTFLALARFSAAHAPERTQAEITKDQAEACGDGHSPGACLSGQVLVVLAAERDRADSGHHEENKACNLQPKLVQNASEGAQGNAARMHYSLQSTILTGELARDPGKNLHFSG